MPKNAWPGLDWLGGPAAIAAAEAPSPIGVQNGGSLRALAPRGILDTFIERHGDVRTQRALNLDGLFRGEQMFGAIEMRAEAHAFVADFAQIGGLNT